MAAQLTGLAVSATIGRTANVWRIHAMTDALILEFEGVGRAEYDAVNDLLGIDMGSGEGDWPPGLLVHTAGATENGWAVFEVWESREAQERFMDERLGKAMQEGGVSGGPSRAEWLDLAAHHSPGG
jgi:hypothetical protein